MQELYGEASWIRGWGPNYVPFAIKGTSYFDFNGRKIMPWMFLRKAQLWRAQNHSNNNRKHLVLVECFLVEELKAIYKTVSIIFSFCRQVNNHREILPSIAIHLSRYPDTQSLLDPQTVLAFIANTQSLCFLLQLQPVHVAKDGCTGFEYFILEMQKFHLWRYSLQKFLFLLTDYFPLQEGLPGSLFNSFSAVYSLVH